VVVLSISVDIFLTTLIIRLIHYFLLSFCREAVVVLLTRLFVVPYFSVCHQV